MYLWVQGHASWVFTQSRSPSTEGHRAGDWLARGPLGHLTQELPGLSALSGEQL